MADLKAGSLLLRIAPVFPIVGAVYSGYSRGERQMSIYPG